MMLKHNNNFKVGRSSHNFVNRLRCASAHCEQAAFCNEFAPANRTRRSLDKSLYSKIIGWSLAILAVFGAFSYLTFIPEQVFAAYDWERRTLSDIDTMQDMNVKICENSEINESKQLEDIRDRVNGQAGTGKKYWVTKLRGDIAGIKEKGECWMTQNLAYSGNSENNIGIPCTLSGTSCFGWGDSITDKYFAIGSHVEDGESAHTSQGNYYNWPAAVQNGSGGTGIQGVCPNGWQLPTSGNISSKSFNNLVDVYGIGNDDKKLHNSPLYFQYSGNVAESSWNNIGYGGNYWSSIPSGSDYAYHMAFNSNYVDPSNISSYRGYGYSVRCVAADVYPEKPSITDNDTANVAITVSPVISIDVTKDANDMTVDFTKVATSTIVARVGSNQPYRVLLSTDKSDLTNSNTNQTIPMIPSDQPIVKGANSWGIKKLSSPTDTTVNDSTIYSPVGINGDKALFYESTSAASEDLTFPVAIAVDSSLPSGQYSTQVTLTAVAM